MLVREKDCSRQREPLRLWSQNDQLDGYTAFGGAIVTSPRDQGQLRNVVQH